MDRPLGTAEPGGEAVVKVPQPGDLIEGKYRVEKVLGEGGMGVVLAAHHELLDQRVAVKVLTSTDPKAISRFSLEAQSTAQLKSEHVARIMDVGKLPNGAPFMVMEYLEGCDLEELLRLNGKLPVEEAVGYALDALDGLAQAHALEIIHRDLKPANLFLAVQASGTSIVKIVDFGISKSIASRRSGKTGVITADHSTVGSPTYMAPEQIRSPKDVGAQSDIWSLGVVLYELLSGAPPFHGDSVGEIFAAVLENKATPLSRLVPNVPEGLSRAVARCMARDRSARYANVLELAVDLAPFGPADAAAKVTRIEQTLRAMKAKAEGKDAPRSAGRVTPEPEDVTAEITASGSHDIRIDAPEPVPPPAPSSRKFLGGKVSGGFSSDTPRAGIRHLATMPSIRRVEGRRRVLAIAGGAATVLAIGIVAFIKSGASPEVTRSGVPSGAPSAMALPPAQGSAADVAGASAQPVASTISVDKLPQVKPRQQAVPGTQPLHRSSAPSAPGKKHLSVLDSPD